MISISYNVLQPIRWPLDCMLSCYDFKNLFSDKSLKIANKEYLII